jgi:xylitol oxidase
MAPLAPRPHWAKLFATDPAVLAARIPRLADFLGLVERFDPRGTFRNRWFERTFLS